MTSLRLVAVLVFSGNMASANTEVRGLLPPGSFWSRDASPYVVTQNLEIEKGATLTIEAGVEVRMGKHSLFVGGTLVARGSEEKPIVFTAGDSSAKPGAWGRIEFQPTSSPGRLDAEDSWQQGSILQHCVVEFGQGILIDRCSPCLLKNRIRFNSGEHAGGILLNGGSPIIRRNEIVCNRSKNDGGGIRTLRCKPVIEFNRISHNHAARNGGGIAIDMNACTIRGNTIEHNSASMGGGLATGVLVAGQSFLSGTDRSNPLIVENVIAHNAASYCAGGAYILGPTEVRDNRILSNRLSVELSDSRGTDRIVPSEFDNPLRGAGLLIEQTYGGRAVIEGNVIASNRGARWGGGLFLTRAGGLVRKNRLVDNEAGGGGGMMAVLTAATTSIGGANREAGLLFEENEIIDNTGGGLEFCGPGPQGVLLRSCNLQGNTRMGVTNYSRNDVTAPNNWWGEGRASDRIHDFYVDKQLGKVDFRDPAQKPRALELPKFEDESRKRLRAAPMNLRVGQAAQDNVGESASIGLAWESPDITEIAGYRVQVCTEVPHGSSLSVVLGLKNLETTATKLRIEGLEFRKRYYVSVVAFDKAGRESGYSLPKAVFTER